MAKDSGPRARPITVSELIARSETDGAFPKSSDDEARTGRRAVGASGMPSHAPAKSARSAKKAKAAKAAPVESAADEPAVGPEANAVTGIIPIVRDDDDFDADATGFIPLEGDDPVGFDLPPVEYRTAPINPVFASAADIEPDPDVTTTTQLQAVVDSEDDWADDDWDDGTHTRVAVAADLVDADDDHADLDPDGSEFDPDDFDEDVDGGGSDPDILAAAKPNKRALRKRARSVKAARETAAGETADSEKAEGEPSAVMAWLALIAEVIVGVAVGAGLFWGFTELWRRYVYLALILAVVVIFAIVTFAHILRKRDLPTTLLALGVGMLVTIGPLVLLAA